MTDKEEGITAICQYKPCGRPIIVTPGHRPRAYCDDSCKMAAYRLRNAGPGSQTATRKVEGSRSQVSEQNVQECQQKLTLAGQRIAKLEGQVALQRERLGQYYQHVAQLERELATYRQIVDLSDRARLEQQLYDIGDQIGYRQFIPAEHSLAVGHGVEYWRAFAEYASDEELAGAIVRVRYFAENLIAVDAQAEVGRLRSRIRELERKLS